MEMINVVSSNINAIGYSEDDRMMQVEFIGGSNYIYYDVSLDEFNSVLSANSVGSEFSKVIKKNKRYEKI